MTFLVLDTDQNEKVIKLRAYEHNLTWSQKNLILKMSLAREITMRQNVYLFL